MKNKIQIAYLSIRNEGHEFYAENLPANTLSLESFGQMALNRLALARQAMPKGELSIRLERQQNDGTTISYNPEAGQLEVLS